MGYNIPGFGEADRGYTNMTIKEMQERAYRNSASKGFHNYTAEAPFNVGEKLALIHSEVSEALEDHRDNKINTLLNAKSGKPEGFGSELADIIIRVGDLAEKMGIDLTQEITTKMLYNESRPHKHGKAY